ncbi:MAG: hypothetical protein MZW92_25995 [Comamonadaceae bacterium]|nr:hypothetical protein [Comamonadaceae bacterium]
MAGTLADELTPAGARGRGGLPRRDVPEPGPAADRVLLSRGGRAASARRLPAAGRAGRRRARSRRAARAGHRLRGARASASPAPGACPRRCSRRCARPAAPRRRAPLRAASSAMRWAGRVANEMADAMLALRARGGCSPRIAQIGERYAAARWASSRASSLAAAESRRAGALPRWLPAMGVQTARRRAGAPAAARRRTPRRADSLSPLQLDVGLAAPLVVRPATAAASRAPTADVLAAGIQDITNAMVAEDFRLNEVLRMVLETMYRALGFRRVVFCLRDPQGPRRWPAASAWATASEAAARAFRVPLRAAVGAGADLFAAVCAKGVDTLIADATAPNIAPRLPPWYREQIGAPARSCCCR